MSKETKNPLGLVFQEAFGIRLEEDEGPREKQALDVTHRESADEAPRAPSPPRRR